MGNPYILQALDCAGLEEVAYKLLLNERYPSWLYPVTVGATTIWEHFGSYRPEAGGLADPWMNSLSHYAHGAVGGFIFGHVGGIRPETPGYRRILVQPTVRPGLSWAKTSYDSIQGRIATAWKVGDRTLDLEVTVPMNATATVHVPATEGSIVLESGGPAERAEAVRLLRREKDVRIFEVGGGHYRFHSVLPSRALKNESTVQ